MTNKEFKIIGLTGQSGAGKSTVTEVFESYGVKAVDADTLAHIALKTEKCKENLRKAFGESIFDESGEVIRKALARLAFADKESTELLNNCTHPVIRELSIKAFENAKSEGYKAVVFDAPTLFESGLDSICSQVVSVIAQKELRAQRIMQRDNLTLSDAMLRLNAQHPDSFYTDKSDFIIENNSTADELTAKAHQLCKELFND